MTPEVFFIPAARVELTAAQNWYEAEARGLGSRFRDEVDRQVRHIADNPSRFPEVIKGVRRTRLRRFPYSVFYRVMPDAIYVIACFHSSRDPVVWKIRI